MIGKPQWFKKRKYTGIGITPVSWQGWIYVGVIIAALIFIRFQPFWVWSDQVKNILTGIWAVIVIADGIHIFSRLKK